MISLDFQSGQEVKGSNTASYDIPTLNILPIYLNEGNLKTSASVSFQKSNGSISRGWT